MASARLDPLAFLQELDGRSQWAEQGSAEWERRLREAEAVASSLVKEADDHADEAETSRQRGSEGLRRALLDLDAVRVEADELKAKLHRAENGAAAIESRLADKRRSAESLSGQLDGVRRDRDNARKAIQDLSAELHEMRATLTKVTFERDEAARGRAGAQETVESRDAEHMSLCVAAAPLVELLWSTPAARPPTLAHALSLAGTRVEGYAEIAAFFGCRRSLAVAKSWLPSLDFASLSRGFARGVRRGEQQRLESEAVAAARAIASSIKANALRRGVERARTSTSSYLHGESGSLAPEPDASEIGPEKNVSS